MTVESQRPLLQGKASPALQSLWREYVLQLRRRESLRVPFALQLALEHLAGGDLRLELPPLDRLLADAPDVLVALLNHLGDLGVREHSKSCL